jgi:hypothetical protein
MTPYQAHFFDWIRFGFAGEQELAFREALAMSEIAPEEAAIPLNLQSLITNRLERAVEACERLETGNGEFLEGFVSHWQGYWNRCTQALHLSGQHEEGLEFALEWRARFPNSSGASQAEAWSRAALGQLEEIRRTVEEWRTYGLSAVEPLWTLTDELRAHGHEEVALEILEGEVARFETDSAYIRPSGNNKAMVLHRLGRNQEAYALWGEEGYLTQENPPFWGVARLGYSAALAGDTSQARVAEEDLSSRPEPKNPYTLLERAKIAAALGDKDRAVQMLEQWAERAIVLNWVLILHRDFTIQSLLGDYPPFLELMRPKE